VLRFAQDDSSYIVMTVRTLATKLRGAMLGIPVVREFLHGTIGLVDGGIHVGDGAGVGVGNGDASERFSSDLIGRFPHGKIGIEQGVISVGVAVGPAPNSDALDILGWIEASGT